MDHREIYQDKELWEALGAWKKVEPRPGYIARFWKAVSSETPWQEKVLEGARNAVIVRPRRFAYAMATIAAIFILAHVGIYSHNQTQAQAFLTSVSEEEWEMIENYDLIADLDLLEGGDNNE